MNAGVGPILERSAARPSTPNQPKRSPPQPPQGLRLPEVRAFEVATINRRLASMAEQATPAAANDRIKR